jgi:peptidoglycan/xylan/chitin deacetylase (PgdA/CDA1 family)
MISLDCEGNWGIADREHRVESGFITRSALIRAYESLVSTLSTYEMRATFAFVMAFTLKKSELSDWMPRLTDVQVDGLNWMRNFRRAEATGNLEGWFCPEAFDLVRDNGVHEIGCHGFRHVPLGNCEVASEEATYELRSATELAKRRGVDLKTFVFPRNHVGHLALLADQGYVGFRNANPVVGRHGRAGNLGREFNIMEASQDPEPSSFGLVSIPGGYFLNWRHGLRRAIPEAVTLMRWRSILDDAVANDRVALLYLHPHNLIDGPGTLKLFHGVLKIASKLQESKGLTIVTQAEYCEARLQERIQADLRPAVGAGIETDIP